MEEDKKDLNRPISFRPGPAGLNHITYLKELWGYTDNSQVILQALKRCVPPDDQMTIPAKVGFSAEALRNYFIRTGVKLPSTQVMAIPVSELPKPLKEHLWECLRMTKSTSLDLNETPVLMKGWLREDDDPNVDELYDDSDDPGPPRTTFWASSVPSPSGDDWISLLTEHQKAYEATRKRFEAILPNFVARLTERLNNLIAAGSFGQSVETILKQSFKRFPLRVLIAYSPALLDVVGEYTAKAWAWEQEQKATNNKAQWIKKKGSVYLKRAFNAGYDCTTLYVKERVAAEIPGFSFIKEGDHITFKPIETPTLQALDLAEQVGGRVMAMYQSVEDHPDYGDCDLFRGEAVVLMKWLGTYTLYQLVESDSEDAPVEVTVGDPEGIVV